MQTFIVRVWLPDRPGALGAVASRIGAVRGDVVGIDILERGDGRALDEITVQLADLSLVDLLVAEVLQVDGVEVEDVRPTPDQPRDPDLDALETAALLMGAGSVGRLLEELASRASHDFEADWCSVIALGDGQPLTSVGATPPPVWLASLVTRPWPSDTAGDQVHVAAAGSLHGSGAEEVAWARLPAAGVSLVLGRGGRAFRTRERRRLAVLSRIGDQRWTELSSREPVS